MKFKKTLVMVLAACMVIGMLAGTSFAATYYGPDANVEIKEGASIPGEILYYVKWTDGKTTEWDGVVLTEKDTPYTGWLQYGDYWTYYKNGVLQRHWQKINGAWYYFDVQGIMVQRGTAWIENRLYFFDETGKCDTTPGLKMIPNYFYVHENGDTKQFFPTEGVAYFYLNQNGCIETGWNYFDNAWHMCDKFSGRLLTNQWYQGEAGIWYYFDEYAEMATGWMTVRDEFKTDKTYYFNSAGALQYGWLNVNGNWYYLNPSDGAARIENSWAKIPANGFWYLFDEDGVMLTGWQAVMVKAPTKGDKEKGIEPSPAEYKWYYLTSWGNMVYGEQKINGQYYDFGKYGQLESVWIDGEGWTDFSDFEHQASWYLVPGESDKEKSEMPAVIEVK
jgi:glucan-binding YG repeat protein